MSIGIMELVDPSSHKKLRLPGLYLKAQALRVKQLKHRFLRRDSRLDE